MECANDNYIKLTATIIKKLSKKPKPRNGTALTIITEIKVEIEIETCCGSEVFGWFR